MKCTKKRSEELESALWYLEEHGFSVIPARTEEKKGSYLESWKPFQERRPEPSEVKRWWRRHHGAGLAIVTGSVSGIIVLDVDPGHGGRETLEGRKRPPTVAVETGGGGVHYYYRYPDIEGLEVINCFTGDNVDLPGLDLRADGGMVYAPPSLHPSGRRYRFFDRLDPGSQELADPPDWLIKVIRKNQKGSGGKSSGRQRSGDVSELWKGVSEGSRNESCARLAGKLLNSNASREQAEEIMLSWNENNDPSMEIAEVVKVVRGIYDRYGDESDFLPGQLAEELDDHLWEVKGERWIYVPDSEMHYCYSQDEGHYRQRKEDYLRERIRAFLEIDKPEWGKKSMIGEVLDAYRHRTQSEEFSRRIMRGGEGSRNLRLINLQNGMLDWEDGKLQKHRPDHLSLCQLPVEFDPEAVCPRWEETLEEWVPDPSARDFLQEFVGYCLIPDTSLHKALVLLGSGAAGKSTFMDVVGSLFGPENRTSLGLKELGQRFKTSKIQHALVNFCDDVDQSFKKNTGTVKSIISGGWIRAEHKYKDSFEFQPITRLVFAANRLPQVGDKTEGWYRRLAIVRFPNSFRPGGGREPHLAKKLKGEKSGILNWALEGLRRLKKNGTFTESDAMQKEKSRYRQGNDSVVAFFNDRVRRADQEQKHKYPTEVVYKRYKEYCEDSGFSPVSRKKMVERMTSGSIELEKSKLRRHRYNLERDDWQDVKKHVEPDWEEVLRGKERYRERKPVPCFVGVDVE